MRRLPFLLLFMIVAISATSTDTRNNHCGVDVTNYKNYMNKSVDVPPKKVADILLARAPFLLRYKKVFTGSKFADQPNTLSDVAVDQWKEMSDGTRIRNVTYQKSIKNPHRSLIPVRETQTVDYQERLIRLQISGRVAEKTVLDHFEASVEICVTPGTVHETDIQIDVLSTFHTPEVREHAQVIQEASNYGMTMDYGALDYLLEKMVRIHRSDPYELNLSANSGNKVISVTSAVVSLVSPSRPTVFTTTKMAPKKTSTESDLSDYFPLLIVLGTIAVLCLTYFCTKKLTRHEATTVRMTELERLEQNVINSISDETPAPLLVVKTESVKELDYEKK